LTIRLHFVVEGQTEETFVNNTLAPHLATFGVVCDARCVEFSRRRRHVSRGGLLQYAKLRDDLQRWMREDDNPDAWFTTMFDLYGLAALDDEFPGYQASSNCGDPHRRVEILEQALRDDLDHHRFVPYVQLHEYEALLFADPTKLDWQFINHERAIPNLVRVRESFPSPEHIDEGQETAPSKRIIREIPEYEHQKVSAGPIVAEKIGLNVLRRECRHFGAWLRLLEGLAGEAND
jgi:hypothetical protein